MPVSNEQIAQRLEEVAELLSSQEANRFRALAYRRAADTVRHLSQPVSDILRGGGLDALQALPSIGESIARAIAEMGETGTLGLLERLRGQADPEALLATLPGIGHELARRIHEQLGVETLEELEVAAHDGRLSAVRGFGSRRVRGAIDALAGRLGSRRSRRPSGPSVAVASLLDVDQEYREKARAGTLHRIAPRRFNPAGEAWLPVLHTQRADHHYTALFSNTARAHELGRTRDWVVIFVDDGARERQATVVTETRGPLAGRRVVRGREPECLAFYGVTEPRATASRAGNSSDPGPEDGQPSSG